LGYLFVVGLALGLQRIEEHLAAQVVSGRAAIPVAGGLQGHAPTAAAAQAAAPQLDAEEAALVLFRGVQRQGSSFAGLTSGRGGGQSTRRTAHG